MLTALRRGSAAVGGQKNPKTRIRTDRTRPLGTKGPQGSLFVVVYALYGVWGVLSDWQSQPAGTVVKLKFSIESDSVSMASRGLPAQLLAKTVGAPVSRGPGPWFSVLGFCLGRRGVLRRGVARAELLISTASANQL